LKKFQWITAVGGLALVSLLYFFGKTTPPGKKRTAAGNTAPSAEITIDTILHHAKEQLKPEQVTWLGTLEKSVIRGDVKGQQLDVYHQLAHFWKDSAGIFEPYAWYEAEAARLENSEKSLTFAGHLFLNNLRSESREPVKKWKAVQARDLFERSLKINPANDSSLVGIGACYIFGNIADNPMEGIQKIRQVAEKDSTNVFAQLMLGHGSAISKQYDRAINRFERVITLQPANLEAIMMLAEVYELKADKPAAIKWYRKATELMTNPEFKAELLKRIEDLSR
jgi:tetratricopeptide (TPR) repeat protein